MVGVMKEVEKLRGLAILAVVLIHATAPATVYYPVGTVKFFFYNTVNSLVQFAVPTFLFISSMVLSRKLDAQPEPLLVFYRKRLTGVILPYLLWSLGYSLLKSWLNDNLGQFFWLSRLANELWTGTAFYHLYFLLIMVQLYLLLPLLTALLRRFSLSAVILLAALSQAGFYLLNRAWLYELYPHPGNLLGSYLPIVLLGCWLGLNYRNKVGFACDAKWSALLLNLVLAAAFVYLNIRVRSNQPVELWHYYTVYHGFVSITGWNLLRLMKLPLGEKLLAKLGRHSFAIYLVHPLFLAFGEKVWPRVGLLSYDTALLAGFFFAVSGSYFFGWVIAQKPCWTRILLGR